MPAMRTISRFFNMIYVEERRDTIYVMNVEGDLIQNMVKKLWPGTRVGTRIFTVVGASFFSFNAFFAPDFVFVLNKLIADPDTTWKQRLIYNRIIELLYTDTWLRRVDQAHKPILDLRRLNEFKLRPYAKQMQFLESFATILPRYGLRGYLLAGAPGSGKTFVDLVVSASLIPRELAEVTIVISPKNALHLVWEKSIKTLFKKPPTAWFSDSGELPQPGFDFYVFNFDALNRAVALANVLVKMGVKFFVVIDESHNLNELTTDRTNYAIQLCMACPESYFLWASGSPVKKMGREMVPFLRASDSRFDKDAERRFSAIFSANAGTATEIFYHRFGIMMAFVIGRKDVMKMDPIIKELPIRLPPAQANRFLLSTIREDMKAYTEEKMRQYQSEFSLYQQIVKNGFNAYARTLTTPEEKGQFEVYKDRFMMIQYDDPNVTSEIRSFCKVYEASYILPELQPDERSAFVSAVSIIKSIRHKVLGEVLGNVVGKRREECSELLALNCRPEHIIDTSLGKVMFFAANVRPLELLNNKLKREGYHPLMATGAHAADFDKGMAEFSTNPAINPILATMKFLSEAIPVVEANTIVFIDRPFRQYAWDQVVARALRLGQKRQVYVIETFLDTGDEPNISTRNDEILNIVRNDVRGLIGDDFAGPVNSERETMAVVDMSDAPVAEEAAPEIKPTLPQR